MRHHTSPGSGKHEGDELAPDAQAGKGPAPLRPDGPPAQQEVLESYAAVSVVSARMLAAARAGEWDALIAEERRCRALIDGLRQIGEVPLSESASKAKHGILRKLLADDAEIRGLTQPWLAQLESMLGTAANARRLNRSYGDAA